MTCAAAVETKPPATAATNAMRADGEAASHSNGRIEELASLSHKLCNEGYVDYEEIGRVVEQNTGEDVQTEQFCEESRVSDAEYEDIK